MRTRIALLIQLTLLNAVYLPAEDIDFNRDVRPILSDKCFFCHGPDRNKLEADLRLDSRETAAEVIESGKLLNRILSDDPDVRMPPVDSKLSLSTRDKQILAAWVKQGSPYKKHWAFELLPQTTEVPNPSGEEWPKRKLDQFVLARIEQAQLKPNSEAAPLRWLRRVTLDLTGLPPKRKQIERFQKRLAAPGASREAVYETTVY